MTVTNIFIDIDGIVAEFIGGACLWHKLENPYAPYDVPRDKPMSFDILKYLDIEPKDFWTPLGRKFWANLPKTREADDIMAAIRNRLPDAEKTFMTTPCRTDGCIDGKLDWLKKYDEDFKDIPVFFSVRARNGPPPKAICAGPQNILIDDHTENVERWRAAGGLGFLFPRPWNANFKHVGDGVLFLDRFLRSVAKVDVFRTPMEVNPTKEEMSYG